MKIYCAHPICGLQAEEIIKYYDEVVERLSDFGYEVFHPIVEKGYMRNEVKFKAEGFGDPVSTNHAISERDKWMVMNCDILFLNLLGTKTISIGCVMELAWAQILNKHTIVVMEKDNIHRHAFVLEAADVVFEDYDDAIEYLGKLIKRKI